MTTFRIIILTVLIAGLGACGPADNSSGSLMATVQDTPEVDERAIAEREVRMAVERASALAKDKRYDEAIAIYEAQLDPGPFEHVVRNNLAALLLDMRSDEASHQRALELMEQYVSAADHILQDTLGWAHYRNGNYIKAIRHLEYAAAYEGTDAINNPDKYPSLDPNIRYHLGMAYAKSGITSGAVYELTRAIELSQEDWEYASDARRMLDELTQSLPDSAG